MAQGSKSDGTTYLKDYKQPDYWVKHADLTFDIHDGKTYVTAQLQVEKNGNHNRSLVLDGEEMKLLEVKVDGTPMGEGKDLASGYVVDDKSLSLQPGSDKFIVETKVEIKPEDNTALEGLYRSSGNWCTQCEAEGFRRITYFVDRPDNMATFTTRIIADPKDAPVLLSNGNKIDEGKMPDGRHFTVWEDPYPKPSYLFAAVGGKLACVTDYFTTMSGRKVELNIFVEKGKEDRCDWAMDSLKRSMKWDEEKWGREYNYDLFNIVAVSDFNMGAMENTSLNIFNDKLVLASPETASDADYESIERVIAHEYFHNWTGNRVTCRDWFQLCLKEGLTVYRDQEFSCDMNERSVKRIADVKLLRAAQFPEDAGPLAHPPRPDNFQTINNFYTVTVYNKGAELNRMLAALLKPEEFRAASDLYFQRFNGQAVTVEDWVQCMADASGRDMSQFMKWYTQAGTPTVTASWDYDKKTKTMTLKVDQDVPKIKGKSDGTPRHMPMCFGIVGPDGKDVISGTMELTKKSQTFKFVNVPEGSVPSLFRDFSAPINLSAPYTSAELLHLMKHDGNGFNQWEAGNRFLLNNMLAQVERVENGQPIAVNRDVIEAFRTILSNKNMDPALKAQALVLPGYTEMALKRKTVDPQAILAVRKAFVESISAMLNDEMVETFRNGAGKAYDPKDAGQRALSNLALSYLAKGPLKTINTIMASWKFANSDNMTDYAASFSALLASASQKQRAKAVESFYNKFKDDPLVVDKWVGLQVSAENGNVLETAKSLANHECFKKPSPNRMRALYGAFMTNPAAFHAADGSGYKFLADFVMELDGKNPQMASRFVGGFADFKRYKPELRAKMEDELKRMASMEKISKDVGEKLESFLGSEEFAKLRGGKAAPGGHAPTPSA